MTRFSSVLTLALMVAAATPALAQRTAPKDSSRKPAIPAEARPPKGMCRVWINGVPAAQQPAATDCASAVKNLPSNAKILFGDESPDSTKKRKDPPKLPPNAKGFSGVKPPKRPPNSP